MSDARGGDPVGAGAAMAQDAGDAVRRVGEQAQQAGAKALGEAQEVAQSAASRGAALSGTVKEQALSAVEAQKGALADRLEDVARAVHRSGEQLEGHQDVVAHLVERGAAELSVLAGTLRSNDLRGLLGGLQDLAQRQPALFAGASLAAGFALARVGKVAVAGASRADLPHLPGTSPEAASPEAASPGASHERE